MKKQILFTTALLVATFTYQPTFAQQKEKAVIVGGAPMYPSKNIIENAVNSKDHTTLVAAVKAAELVDALSGKGPFTVFAPTDKAFSLLPKGTIDNLIKPENKTTLTNILTYHVIAGNFTNTDIWKLLKEGHGKTQLTTLQGENLTIWADGKKLYIRDSKGTDAKLTISDVIQSNGVIHVIDKVLIP